MRTVIARYHREQIRIAVAVQVSLHERLEKLKELRPQPGLPLEAAAWRPRDGFGDAVPAR